MKPTSNPTTNNAMLYLDRYDGFTGQTAWQFGTYNNSGTMQLRLIVSNDGTSFNVHPVNYTPTTGAWHHYAVVFTAASHKAEFFVDGVSVGSDSSGSITSIKSSTLPLTIGGQSGSYYDGKMDEVRIWNVARTSTAISGDYNNELTGSETGLQAYYPFETL